MSTTTPNLGLVIWNTADSPFDYAQLSSNFTILDNKFSPIGVFTTPVRFVEPVSSLPAPGTQGRLVYTLNAVTGFAANLILRDTGSSWATVGPVEVQSGLPTSGNFQGRVIVLSTAASGFSQWDMVVNTDGANSWNKVGAVATSATVAGFSNNYAGKLGVLTSADSPYSAYSLLVYTGSAWQSVETRGVQTGTSLPGSPYTGQVFCLTAALNPYSQYDVLRWNGTAWGQISSPPLLTTTAFNLLTSIPDGFECYLQVDASNGINWHLRYRSGRTYPWEFVGGSPMVGYQSSSDSISTTYTQLGTTITITTPRTGVYNVKFGATILSPGTTDTTFLFAPNWSGNAAADSKAWGNNVNLSATVGSSTSGMVNSATIPISTVITLYARSTGGTGTSTFIGYVELYPIMIQ